MKIKFCAVLSLLLLIISCNQKDNNTDSIFQEVSRTKSQFDKVGIYYKYLYKGDIKNISSNILDKVVTTVEVEFLLENGNVITQKDYQTVFPTSGMDFKYSWKPNEIMSIDDDEEKNSRLLYPLSYPDGDKGTGLSSGYIPSRYKDYPIKRVLAILYFETTDVVNQKENTYQNIIDITEEWNKLK